MIDKSIIETLQTSLQGRIKENTALAPITWFQVGGSADFTYRPKDMDDLGKFLMLLPEDIPVFTMGVGSNILVRDQGIKGAVLRLGRPFNYIKQINEETLEVGASTLDKNIALFGHHNGLGGLEFLAGVPGTFGGGIRMNAGAYGSEIASVVTKIFGMDRQGNLLEFSNNEAKFSYRKCNLPQDIIFTHAHIKVYKESPTIIAEKLDFIEKSRASTQPIRTRTGGSTFKNPEDKKAWQLIDAAGCRGLRIGQAKVSDLHCNFLVNEGNAKAKDIEDLGEEVKKRVFQHSGIHLDWEIIRVGQSG